MLDAMAGVDIALWDLAGQLHALPVSKLIAGVLAKSSVPAYLSGLTGASVEHKVEFAVTHYKNGFRLFKLFHDSDTSSLLALLDKLRDWGLMPEGVTAHKDLGDSLQTPLALGESYRTTFEMEPFFENHVFQFLQPDLGRTGITGGLRLAARAAALGMEVVPHVSIAMAPQIAAAIHFAAAAPACNICEFNPAVVEIANRYSPQPIVVENARYIISGNPGLGVTIFEESLRRDIVR